MVFSLSCALQANRIKRYKACKREIFNNNARRSSIIQISRKTLNAEMPDGIVAKLRFANFFAALHGPRVIVDFGEIR